MTPEQQYNIFKESGDLKEFFPKMKGEWALDKDRFIKSWVKTNQILEEAEYEDDEDI